MTTARGKRVRAQLISHSCQPMPPPIIDMLSTKTRRAERKCFLSFFLAIPTLLSSDAVITILVQHYEGNLDETGKWEDTCARTQSTHAHEHTHAHTHTGTHVHSPTHSHTQSAGECRSLSRKEERHSTSVTHTPPPWGGLSVILCPLHSATKPRVNNPCLSLMLHCTGCW